MTEASMFDKSGDMTHYAHLVQGMRNRLLDNTTVYLEEVDGTEYWVDSKTVNPKVKITYTGILRGVKSREEKDDEGNITLTGMLHFDEGVRIPFRFPQRKRSF